MLDAHQPTHTHCRQALYDFFFCCSVCGFKEICRCICKQRLLFSQAPRSPEKSLLSRSQSDPSRQLAPGQRTSLPVSRPPQPHLSPLADEEYFERLQQQLESASVPASAGPSPAPTTHTSHTYTMPSMAYSMPMSMRTQPDQLSYHYSTPQHRGTPHVGISPPFVSAHSPSQFGGSRLHHHYTAPQMQRPMMQYGSSPQYGNTPPAPSADTMGMNNLYMLANASAQHIGYGEVDEEKTALTKSASAPLERQRPLGFGPTMGIHDASPLGNNSINSGQDSGASNSSDARPGSVWRPF